MRDDSDKVPGLLTDYILNGELCSLPFFTEDITDASCF